MGMSDWTQTAIALAAVMVALCGRPIRHWLMRPRLDLRIKDPAGFRAGKATWYHLVASNPRRWTSVTDVRVYLLKIEMDGLSKPWIDKVPLRWRHQEPGRERLEIGDSSDCDLCLIGEDQRLTLQQAIKWGLLGPVASFKAPVRMTLTVQARGAEAVSARLRLALHWAGGDRLTLKPA